jgi:hypothetical protein
MTPRVLISLALWGRVLASKCPSGNCYDDNVLMQAGISRDVTAVSPISIMKIA